jgi:hypothetical protein
MEPVLSLLPAASGAQPSHNHWPSEPTLPTAASRFNSAEFATSRGVKRHFGGIAACAPFRSGCCSLT